MTNEERITLLQNLVQIKSINGNEKEVAIYLQKVLEAHSIEGELIDYDPKRSNLVAEIGVDTGKVLGLTGHMDVVDPGDRSLWKHDPFAAVIEENRLYGRGATDMKSGLAAMVIAMIELKKEGVKLGGKLRLLATVGEEVGELGAEQLTEKGYADDLSGLIIGEPTNYNIVYTHMGSLNYSVKSIGKEAHSSMPQNGINAINNLMLFMEKANQQMAKISNEYFDEELGRTIHNITVIDGGNQVNSIPGEAHLQGNIRSIPAFGNQQIIKLLETIIAELNQQKEVQLELTIDFNKIPVKTAKDSKLIETIQGIQQAKTGEIMPLLGIAGTTDAAEFTKAKKEFDFAVFGPGQNDLPHQVNEFVKIDNYLDMIDMYKKIIVAYLN